MRRRTLLTIVGAGSISLAGCAARTEMAGGEALPDACPTSRDLGVEWPRDLDESTVASFVEEYELAYYQQAVFDDVFEPQSRLDTYEGWIGRVTEVTEIDGGGWRADFEGIVNIRRGDLFVVATTTDPPGDADVIPVDQLDDEELTTILEEAAASGRAEERFGPGQTDKYLDRFAMLSEELELTDIEDSHTVFVDVDGTTVELVVSWSPPNRDHFWYVQYYVDEHVVWRSAQDDIDPREGELLECRTSS